MSDLPNIQQIGKYRLVRPLGKGGMGVVYEAWDETLQRTVALKLMLAHIAMNEQLRLRFHQEALAVGKLDHPNIVKIFDFDTQGEMIYMVMEYMAGGSLAAYFRQSYKQGKLLQIQEVLALIRQIAAALDFAHRHHMIHRDVKPDNVLLRPLDSAHAALPFNAVLTDFGLAKLADHALVQTMSVNPMGTPPYMAPEQLKGETVDGRADLYALGAMFYQLVCGDLPFKPKDMIEAMQTIDTPPPLPSHFRHGISPLLEAVLLKSIAKSKGARYQSGQDLIEAINALEKGVNAGTEPPLVQESDHAHIDYFATYFNSVLPSMSPSRLFSEAPPALALDRIAARAQDLPKQDLFLSDFPLYIGRDPENDLPLESKRISRRHLRIDKVGKLYTVTDLATTNGSRMGEQRLQPNQPTVWNPNLGVMIGEYMLMLQLSPENTDAYYAALRQPPTLDRTAPMTMPTPSPSSAPTPPFPHPPASQISTPASIATPPLAPPPNAVRSLPPTQSDRSGYQGPPSAYGAYTPPPSSPPPYPYKPQPIAQQPPYPPSPAYQPPPAYQAPVYPPNIAPLPTPLPQSQYPTRQRRMPNGVWYIVPLVVLLMVGAIVGGIVLLGGDDGSANNGNTRQNDNDNSANDNSANDNSASGGDTNQNGNADGLLDFSASPTSTRGINESALIPTLTPTPSPRPLEATPTQFIPLSNVTVVSATPLPPSNTPTATRPTNTPTRTPTATITPRPMDTLRPTATPTRRPTNTPAPTRVAVAANFSTDNLSRMTLLTTFSNHTDQVFQAAFSPDGRTLATASKDGTIRIYNLLTLRETHVIRNHTGEVYDVAFSPNGNRLASVGDDSYLRIYDVNDNYRQLRSMIGYTNPLNSVAWNPDSRQAAVVSIGGTLRVWDTVTGYEVGAVQAHSNVVYAVDYSADGSLIATCGSDRRIHLWDSTGTRKIKELGTHSNDVLQIDFSPVSNILASGGVDGVAKMWNVNNSATLATFGNFYQWSNTVNFSPDGELLASADNAGDVWIYNVDAERLAHGFSAHNGQIFDVVFNPQAPILVTVGREGLVKVWALPNAQDRLR